MLPEETTGWPQPGYTQGVALVINYLFKPVDTESEPQVAFMGPISLPRKQ